MTPTQDADWKSVLDALQRGQQSAVPTVDWSKVDWSSLSAKDVGVRMGKPMTEEEFAAYRAKRQEAVHVIKHPGHGDKTAGSSTSTKNS